MLERYDCRSAADYTNALREILQEVTLLEPIAIFHEIVSRVAVV